MFKMQFFWATFIKRQQVGFRGWWRVQPLEISGKEQQMGTDGMLFDPTAGTPMECGIWAPRSSRTGGSTLKELTAPISCLTAELLGILCLPFDTARLHGIHGKINQEPHAWAGMPTCHSASSRNAPPADATKGSGLEPEEFSILQLPDSGCFIPGCLEGAGK